jgi:hypothetical protein
MVGVVLVKVRFSAVHEGLLQVDPALNFKEIYGTPTNRNNPEWLDDVMAGRFSGLKGMTMTASGTSPSCANVNRMCETCTA